VANQLKSNTMINPSQIDTHYARSGKLHIAYQQYGSGNLDLVVIPGWASHVEEMWNFPETADFLQRIARFARVLIIDRRGTGLSDSVTEMPTLEERMDDVRAVMDHAGVESASIFGISEGGPMAMMFAASFPERTEKLVLFGTFARMVETEGYDVGIGDKEGRTFVKGIEKNWGNGNAAQIFAPSRANDPAFVKMWGRFERHSMGPGSATKLLSLNFETDVRDVLTSVQAPTLVLHRTGDGAIPVQLGKYVSETIMGARFVELDGNDHFFSIGDLEIFLSEVEHFLTGQSVESEADRVLATILFADIVDSTEKAAAMGDREWKHLLARYYEAADTALNRFRGRKLDTAGDGLFASFDGPARAVRCGMALHDAAASLGVQLRVGIHTGECEAIGEKLGGIAVHIGARIASHANPGEILVSSTVKALTVGSGLTYADKGIHKLKGIDDDWQLFEATQTK